MARAGDVRMWMLGTLITALILGATGNPDPHVHAWDWGGCLHGPAGLCLGGVPGPVSRDWCGSGTNPLGLVCDETVGLHNHVCERVWRWERCCVSAECGTVALRMPEGVWAFLVPVWGNCVQHNRMSNDEGSSSRIVNGSDCKRDSQPWQGALLLAPSKLYCGAGLAADRRALPEAVSGAALERGVGVETGLGVYRIRLGHHSMSPVYESGQQMFRGVKSIPHPGYSHPGHSNDLMLIKLNKEIQVSRSVRPVNITSHCPAPGTQCLVSGWGSTSSFQHIFPRTLQCLNIKVLSQERCKDAYPGQIDDTMFCAGDEDARDSCQGDSGGPVVCNSYLQGLVSWGDFPCAQPNRPGVYTNLCHFNKWIHNTIKNN
ncbi:Kallikrein-5 [Heterocephalus glaber]|uniref:Kallikrein-5 n=1 Tax=Heterocephalus glaber TaxID=10181 RepID=G5BRA2_HETGA|nr:Kallikrein-5 [Heterocephalus glaber]